jgi:hypothetical protein
LHPTAEQQRGTGEIPARFLGTDQHLSKLCDDFRLGPAMPVQGESTCPRGVGCYRRPAFGNTTGNGGLFIFQQDYP